MRRGGREERQRKRVWEREWERNEKVGKGERETWPYLVPGKIFR